MLRNSYGCVGILYVPERELNKAVWKALVEIDNGVEHGTAVNNAALRYQRDPATINLYCFAFESLSN